MPKSRGERPAEAPRTPTLQKKTKSAGAGLTVAEILAKPASWRTSATKPVLAEALEVLIEHIRNLPEPTSSAAPASVAPIFAAVAAGVPLTPSAPAGPSPKEIEIFRKSVHKGIRNCLKWKPACKRGTAVFAFEGIIPSATYHAALNIDTTGKRKVGKQTRIDNSWFSKIFGGFRCRHPRWSTRNLGRRAVHVKGADVRF
ncbi:hypothetical protein BDK51DRAFT_26881 [Blyttiomyces helicus]|uniref:Uncharacterized protein n=1 Tax=Blyttiomyces helicus TaxID=388810 RepID=A0A4P9W5V4_9FUNG|nr:hypothetical protein BDK51DRAFT_26881 [Blyttiomyces helicus]|eukprot:RKO87654.1 hypothetical protein BDK51DRAFT_26881 [Blyttiomyces helicus]